MGLKVRYEMGVKFVNLADERLGVVNKNKFGSIMEVVKYKNAGDIWVKFEKGNPIHTTWDCFKIGEVKNPYDKSIYGLGYIGEGNYKPKINCKDTIQYQTWRAMIQRCYDEDFLKKHPTYRNCAVIEEWHNYQKFAQWFDDNYYDMGEKMHLDKDILIKSNKLYSPETCVFVPQRVNVLFVRNDSIRGNLPIGVHLEKQTKKYKAQCKINKGKIKNLGRYNTVEEAFLVYKAFKEKYIKEVANEYKNNIPNKLYNAMINYIVEITD
jgi:hypothetical protein